MDALLSEGLILPAVGLGMIGFVVPRLLAMFLPEGVWPLMLNGLLSTLVTFVAASCLFLLLYLGRGAPLVGITSGGWVAAMIFFGRLGLASALIWTPIMLLSLAGLPKKWVHETW